VDEVLEMFADAADEDGTISREAFNAVFEEIMTNRDGGASDDDADRARLVMSRLYALFDTDGDGVVDFTELTSGLSVLCGGDHDAKARAAFELYDYNGDGVISQDEMTRYLECVFKVMYSTQPGTQESMGGVGAEELAAVTAQECFIEADSDQDGNLSFEEFQAWYSSSQVAGLEVAANIDAAAAEPTSMVPNLNQALEDAPEWVTMAEVQRLTNLSAYSVDDVMERLADAADDEGTIDKPSFIEAFDEIVVKERSEEDVARCKIVVDRMFQLFDRDNNGVVDFTELSSGLSVLCGGDEDEKVAAVFQLYDINNDEAITADEMTAYLASVFGVLFEAMPSIAAKAGTDALRLAKETASACFAQADLNADGKLSFTEYKAWAANNGAIGIVQNLAGGETTNAGAGAEESKDAGADADATAEPESRLASIKKTLRLDLHDTKDVFEMFEDSASSEGTIEFDAFARTMAALIDDTDVAASSDVTVLTKELYGAFDSDGNGKVDMTEIKAGLALLVGDSAEAKMVAVFKLYDKDGDQAISMSEMSSYLNAVFKLLFMANPEAAAALGATVGEMASATALQAFKGADKDESGLLSLDEFKAWYSEQKVGETSGPAGLLKKLE
jgi:Ca2+-binding EF-hand superfamily protein